jgi:hypothetical protein
MLTNSWKEKIRIKLKISSKPITCTKTQNSMILTKRVLPSHFIFFFVYLHMFENFQLPSDSCEDKVEVLFSMDPGQVVQEQVVG